MRVIRQCKQCGGMTSHITGDPPQLPRALAPLLWPVVWLFDEVVDPRLCLTCLERGDQGEDD
jgi:hypothetical protein